MSLIIEVFLENSQSSDFFKRGDVLGQGLGLFYQLVKQVGEEVQLQVLELFLIFDVELDQIEGVCQLLNLLGRQNFVDSWRCVPKKPSLAHIKLIFIFTLRVHLFP